MFLPPPLLCIIILLAHTHTASFCCTNSHLNKQQQTAATQNDQPVFTALSKPLEFYNSRNLKKTTTSGACLSKLLGRSGLKGRCTYYSISNCCREVSCYAATHTKDNEAAAIQDQQQLHVEASGNVMAHAQKPDLVFRRNGRVHLNQRGRQFSRLLAAEVCASAVVMLNTLCFEVV